MLQIQQVSKTYVTGDLTQVALNDVSFNLRDNEFVAVLGQSGSGKTTLLNIIGGLDRYDSGDMIINGISTKKYKDRDWDSYRNHTIGFVFQSYNLIPHQSVLSNVELALTISGVSKAERRKRATHALTEVGLGDQLHKKPNQMSGGQMQRVAIARALVNDPQILLADEPTGALDSETSIQVMDLLRDVAKDRLVVMVTHNPDLANEYANRTIKLHDGRIIGDSNPYDLDADTLPAPEHKNMGKSSMSFLTSLSLSFNNLRTKMSRTLLTSFAGSIGIIGIALIISLSSGVNAYIDDIQKDTMTSYPITIDAKSMDLSSLIEAGRESASTDVTHALDGVYSNSTGLEMASSSTTSVKENNLTKFKQYLDNPSSEIHQSLGKNGIVYSYDVQFTAYSHDPDGVLVNADGSDFDANTPMMPMQGMGDFGSVPGVGSSNNFEQLIPGDGDVLVSDVVKDSYDVVSGEWPQSYDQVVLVLDANNEISSSVLYDLGLLPSSEYKELLKQIDEGESVHFDSHEWTYDEIANQVFYLIPASDYYVQGSDGFFTYIGDDDSAVKDLLNDAVTLTVTGVVRPNADNSNVTITGTVGYTKALTEYMIDHADNSPVVEAQESSPDINVLSGLSFAPADDAAKERDAVDYISTLGISDKASMAKSMFSAVYADDPATLQQMMGMSEDQLAAMMDQYLQDPDSDTLLTIYNTYVSPGTYDDNMSTFGYVSLDAPSSISLYADSFDAKDGISTSIDDYNKDVDTVDQITYTDYVGLLMSSVTTIVNVISYVLIAFVAVSLVVSSIMIGIITYISVLERTKEIGILRALGASKRNISQVFNAETFIVGLLSGVIGIVITLLLLIPGNIAIHALTGVATVNASLPWLGAIGLIVLSLVLTLIAGIIPSRQAAKKDPVIALRTE